MPYTTTDTSVVADGKVQLGAELDKLVEAGTITMQEALETAQARGLTTGPGNDAYMPPGYQAAADAALNETSRQSADRSAAYQATRAGNPAGYTKESQDAFNAAHPLSEY